MTDTQAKPFYKHENYAASYYALYIALERWIADTIFRYDVTRVFLASDEYAFRRRFELTDPSINYEQLPISSLQFPFANYWPSQLGWRPDDRVASNPAALVISGISAQSRLLRAMAVKADIPMTFYFDREDDARLAFEKLLWTAYVERYMQTQFAWRDEAIDLPLNVRISELQFNPDFKENDWLKQNRIFTIRATIGLRSFSLEPPPQAELSVDAPVAIDEKFYLTEQVLLYLEQAGKIVNTLQVESIYSQDMSIVVNQLGAASSSYDMARITWDVQVNSEDSLASMTFDIKGVGVTVIESPELAGQAFLGGLQANSTYVCLVTIASTLGSSKIVRIEINTTINPANKEEIVAPGTSLVGITWQ